MWGGGRTRVFLAFAVNPLTTHDLLKTEHGSTGNYICRDTGPTFGRSLNFWRALLESLSSPLYSRVLWPSNR